MHRSEEGAPAIAAGGGHAHMHPFPPRTALLVKRTLLATVRCLRQEGWLSACTELKWHAWERRHRHDGPEHAGIYLPPLIPDPIEEETFDTEFCWIYRVGWLGACTELNRPNGHAGVRKNMFDNRFLSFIQYV